MALCGACKLPQVMLHRLHAPEVPACQSRTLSDVMCSWLVVVAKDGSQAWRLYSQRLSEALQLSPTVGLPGIQTLPHMSSNIGSGSATYLASNLTLCTWSVLTAVLGLCVSVTTPSSTQPALVRLLNSQLPWSNPKKPPATQGPRILPL